MKAWHLVSTCRVLCTRDFVFIFQCSYDNHILAGASLTVSEDQVLAVSVGWWVRRERSRKPSPSAFSGLVVSCREPLCEIPPMTWSWKKYQAGKVVQDPIHDEAMRKKPDRQGRRGHKGPSRLASASTPPCILPPFLLLFLFALVWILVLPAESSPAPLSLNKYQLKMLINKSPGCWYPIKGPWMKEMLPFKPFSWHSGLFDKSVLSLHKMLMIVLNILSTVR